MVQLLFLAVSIIFFDCSSATNNDASLNSLIDEIVKNVALSGEDIGLEPLKIPDIHQAKEQNGGMQVFNLTQGELINIKSIQRFGDAEASYNSGTLNLKVGFQFSELEGNFNFDVITWGFNPNGRLTAIIPDLAVFVDASVDPINFNATLNKVLIPSVGDLKVAISTTKPIYGMIMEGLIDSLTLLLQDEIVYVLGKVITTKVNELIVHFKNLIEDKD